MQRVVVLSHVFLKALATPPPELLANFTKEEDKAKLAAGTQQLFDKQMERIRSADLWELFEESEREFMQAGVFETTMRQRVNVSWLAESIMCLMWALGLREQIPPYDGETDPRTNKFREGQRARDLIAATKKIPDALPNGTTMVEIIRMTAEKAAKEGVFAEPISGDFPAFGKPYREISDEQLSQLTSIAMERHKAFNWLCGYAPENRWSETPTDT
jgi:hypothetical protein